MNQPYDWRTDLTGKRLVSVEKKAIGFYGEGLVLTFDDGTQTKYAPEGDCCSTTWIEHLTVPDLGDGATVFSVKDSDPLEATEEQKAKSDAEREWGTDYLQVYHTSIATDKGEVIIEYRNDSNGYYGGSLSEVK